MYPDWASFVKSIIVMLTITIGHGGGRGAAGAAVLRRGGASGRVHAREQDAARQSARDQQDGEGVRGEARDPALAARAAQREADRRRPDRARARPGRARLAPRDRGGGGRALVAPARPPADRHAAHRQRGVLRPAARRVPHRLPRNRARASRGGVPPDRGAHRGARAGRRRGGAPHRREGVRDVAVRPRRAPRRAPSEPPAGAEPRGHAARAGEHALRPLPPRVCPARAHPRRLPPQRFQACRRERELPLGLHRRHGGGQHRARAPADDHLPAARSPPGALGAAERARHPVERGAHLAAQPTPAARDARLDRPRAAPARERGHAQRRRGTGAASIAIVTRMKRASRAPRAAGPDDGDEASPYFEASTFSSALGAFLAAFFSTFFSAFFTSAFGATAGAATGATAGAAAGAAAAGAAAGAALASSAKAGAEAARNAKATRALSIFMVSGVS